MASREFMAEMLSAHNNYRSTHGAPPLRLNRDLSNMAQNWANQLARTNTFQHSKNRSYRGQPVGENLAMSYSSAGDEYTGTYCPGTTFSYELVIMQLNYNLRQDVWITSWL